MALVTFILALLMPAALASSSSGCLNATLPNILNLEKCLGTSLDLCTATVADILAAVVRVVVCLINALLKLNVLGALAALLDIIEIVLSVLGLDLGTLTNLITPLCCVSNVRGCLKILSTNYTCKEPIPVTLPGNLNLGECLTDTLLLCKNGDLATDQLLVNLIKALACLLNTLLSADPTGLINGLACAVVSLLAGVAAGANIVLKTALLSLSASIKLTAQCP